MLRRWLSQLHVRAPRLAFAAICTLYCSPVGGSTLGDGAASVDIAFALTAENAPRHLALVLRELAEPRWARLVGRRLDAEDATTERCRDEQSEARGSSTSEQLFNLARCLGVWPPASQAPLEQLLQTRFGGAKAADFPDVTVVSGTGRRIVPVGALGPQVANDRTVQQARAPEQLPAAVRQSLCDQRKTFLSSPDCLVGLRSTSRGLAVIQLTTTYRVILRRHVPQDEAPALIEAVRLSVSRGDARAPADAVGVVFHQQRRAVGEQTLSDGTPTAVPRTTREVWTEMGLRGPSGDLPVVPAAPVIVVDSYEESDAPSLAKLAEKFAHLPALPLPQRLGLAGLRHTEGVASVLFPRLGEARTGGGPPSFDPAAVRGGLRRRDDIFSTGANWQYLLNSFGVGTTEPSVFVSAWSDAGAGSIQPSLQSEGAAWLHRQLESYSVIAVLSAGKARNRSAPEPAPMRNIEQLGANCPVWPSCMGGLPWAVTVAAAEMGPDGPRLADPALYALGARSVMLSAIGRRVPVLHLPDTPDQSPHVGEEPRTVNASIADGSSFAAPAVALLASELISLRRKASAAETPRLALLRIFATVDPLQPVAETRDLVRYGHINLDRALIGADRAWTGSEREGYAALYPVPQSGEQVTPRRAVVESYPLFDVESNLIRLAPEAELLSLRFGAGRGWLTLRSAAGEKETIPLETVLRISHDAGTRDCIRRRQIEPGAACPDRSEPMFDVYFLRKESWQLQPALGRDGVQPPEVPILEVVVRRSVRFGEVPDVRQGRCRVDGEDGVDQPPRPACLYMAEADVASGNAPRFAPINLWAFEDIVFPPNHAFLDRFRGYSARRPEQCYGLLGSAWSDTVARVGLPGELQARSNRPGLARQLRTACRVQRS